ncbi:hypothetical protein COBT_000333 [Conglomerata obtusa]
MNYRKTPTFSFNKPYQPKPLNITYKAIVPNNSNSVDICDEIDSLLSDFENNANNVICETNTSTNNATNNIKKRDEMSNSTKNNSKNGSQIDLFSERNMFVPDKNINEDKEDDMKILSTNFQSDRAILSRDVDFKLTDAHNVKQKINQNCDQKPNFACEVTHKDNLENCNKILSCDKNIIKLPNNVDAQFFIKRNEIELDDYMNNKEYEDKHDTKVEKHLNETTDSSSKIIKNNENNEKSDYIGLNNLRKKFESNDNNFKLNFKYDFKIPFTKFTEIKNTIINDHSLPLPNNDTNHDLKCPYTQIKKLADNLQHEYTDLKNFCSDFQDEKQKLSNLISKLEAKNAILIIEKQKLLAKIIKKNQIQALQNEYKSNVEFSKKEIDELKKIVNEIQEHYDMRFTKFNNEKNDLIIEKNKLVKESVKINKSFQEEIDSLNKKFIDQNILYEKLLQENSSLRETKAQDTIKNKELIETITHQENEINSLNEKLKIYKEKLCNITQTHENHLIESNKKLEEIDQILEINKSLKSEIYELSYLKDEIKKLKTINEENKILAKKQEDNLIILKEENSYILNEIQRHKDDNALYKERLIKKNIKLNGKRHNLSLSMTNIKKYETMIVDYIFVIQKTIKQYSHASIADYYQQLYENEIKKFNKEKIEYNNRLNLLMLENKRYKKDCNLNILKSKYIEPSDSDVWNVFN